MSFYLDAGRISKKIADELAEKEFEKYNAKQKEIELQQDLKELENDIKAIGNKKGKKK